MDDQNGVNNNPPYNNSAGQMPAKGFGPPPSSDSAAPKPEPVYPDPINQSSPQPSTGQDAGVDNLMSIKQDAISQLTPLVKHLDQSPEERFRTTLMMIQVSDNQDLIKDAYEAAGQITDDKAKAQALLDIVNEINYFTKQAN